MKDKEIGSNSYYHRISNDDFQKIQSVYVMADNINHLVKTFNLSETQSFVDGTKSMSIQPNTSFGVFVVQYDYEKHSSIPSFDGPTNSLPEKNQIMPESPLINDNSKVVDVEMPGDLNIESPKTNLIQPLILDIDQLIIESTPDSDRITTKSISEEEHSPPISDLPNVDLAINEPLEEVNLDDTEQSPVDNMSVINQSTFEELEEELESDSTLNEAEVLQSTQPVVEVDDYSGLLAEKNTEGDINLQLPSQEPIALTDGINNASDIILEQLIMTPCVEACDAHSDLIASFDPSNASLFRHLCLGACAAQEANAENHNADMDII